MSYVIKMLSKNELKLFGVIFFRRKSALTISDCGLFELSSYLLFLDFLIRIIFE